MNDVSDSEEAMPTSRHVFRFSGDDLSIMDRLHQLHGLSNRSALLRWLVYREARAQGILGDSPEAELRKGRPIEDLGRAKKIPKKSRKRD